MIARNILLILAALLIIFNLLGYAGGMTGLPENKYERIGYYIGFNFFIIIGIILIVIAWFLHRKVMRKRKNDIMDSFLKDTPDRM